MYLVACPRCDTALLVVKEDARGVWCERCYRTVNHHRAEPVDDPAELKRQALWPLLRPGHSMQVISLVQSFCGAALGVSISPGLLSVGPNDWAYAALFGSTALLLFIGGIATVVGARLMLRGSWGFGVAAAWVLIASPLLVGVFVGIWVLQELYRPGVREALAYRPPPD